MLGSLLTWVRGSRRRRRWSRKGSRNKGSSSRRRGAGVFFVAGAGSAWGLYFFFYNGVKFQLQVRFVRLLTQRRPAHVGRSSLNNNWGKWIKEDDQAYFAG